MHCIFSPRAEERTKIYGVECRADRLLVFAGPWVQEKKIHRPRWIRADTAVKIRDTFGLPCAHADSVGASD